MSAATRQALGRLRVVRAICAACRAERRPEDTRGGRLLLARRDPAAYILRGCRPCPTCGSDRVRMWLDLTGLRRRR